MDEALRFIGEHGYTLLFAWVWIEQFGLPVPGEPMLVAAGALVGAGQLCFTVVLGVAATASLLADLGWYAIGRRWGSPVLRFLCRITLEPDFCGRRARDLFHRLGGVGLVIAKFVPGLNTLTQPVAGSLAMPLGRFGLFDAIGAVVWLGTFLGPGYAFSHGLIRALAYARGVAIAMFVALVGGLTA